MSSQARTLDNCSLAAELAKRLRASRRDLARAWLERINERVALSADRVFPTQELLDHVPLLIDGIADYVQDPAEELRTDASVAEHAMQLGELRHEQGFDVYEILKEFEILGGILFHHVALAADEVEDPCDKSELLVCGHRLFRAIAIVQQTTTTRFLRLADEKVAEREDRLRTFNRTLSHEIKNRIGAILGAAEVLDTLDEAALDRKRFQEIVARNARAMQHTVENLVAISRTEKDARQHRNVRLPEAAKEAGRQVREAAQAARVDVRIDDLPDIEVNAAVVELSLTNYLSNAIKYADQQSGAPTVEVAGRVEEGPNGREIVVRVHDNGIGVPSQKRDGLFERYFRAHEDTSNAEGTGLGLSIVREAVESVGGRAWAEFPDRGSVFAFSLPCQREEGSDRRSSSS